MSKGYFALWIIGIVVFIFDIGIVASLLRKGDERKHMIILKSGCFSFIVVIISLTLKCLTFLLGPILNIQFDNYTNHSDDFFSLTFAVVTFLFAVRYNRNKMGD